MDHMTEYELVDIIDNIPYIDVNNWEQARLQVYAICQVMSKKHLKPTDLLTFPWEKSKEQPTSKLPTTITDSDINRLKEKAKQFEIN